ncbi:MAG: hypothetical protein FD123_627 [Bacteroidetes bacterium]|nr:MAG: hypothetical protein FD123_627 [Bacteroidota bacterium]
MPFSIHKAYTLVLVTIFSCFFAEIYGKAVYEDFSFEIYSGDQKIVALTDSTDLTIIGEIHSYTEQNTAVRMMLLQQLAQSGRPCCFLIEFSKSSGVLLDSLVKTGDLETLREVCNTTPGLSGKYDTFAWISGYNKNHPVKISIRGIDAELHSLYSMRAIAWLLPPSDKGCPASFTALAAALRAGEYREANDREANKYMNLIRSSFAKDSAGFREWMGAARSSRLREILGNYNEKLCVPNLSLDDTASARLRERMLTANILSEISGFRKQFPGGRIFLQIGMAHITLHSKGVDVLQPAVQVVLGQLNGSLAAKICLLAYDMPLAAQPLKGLMHPVNETNPLNGKPITYALMPYLEDKGQEQIDYVMYLAK